ncbi:hypothetical protein FOZ63_003370 [Perkinsus olseni]|uniref:Uncharacterized protein n=1 Tax=Perkinsus olseni TaxID=32597 RepID=A0A7J6RFH1_PEROL|nr:hypothetical protein FOZ63_003370 [Perkinsus olseni]
MFFRINNVHPPTVEVDAVGIITNKTSPTQLRLVSPTRVVGEAVSSTAAQTTTSPTNITTAVVGGGPAKEVNVEREIGRRGERFLVSPGARWDRAEVHLLSEREDSLTQSLAGIPCGASGTAAKGGAESGGASFLAPDMS